MAYDCSQPVNRGVNLRTGKISDVRMLKMVDEGISQVKIAEHFGVSKQAVSKRIKELRGKTTKVITTKKVKQAVDDRLDAIAQLKKINDEANRLLDELEEDPGLKIKVMAEIRQQLGLQLQIFQALYDVRAAKEFQDEVIAAIGEADPDVRDRIIRRLNERRAIRSALTFA